MIKVRNVCKAWFERVAWAWRLPVLLVALGAVAAEAAPFAYVTEQTSGTVSVIDTATNTVVATVAVGSRPSAVAITPNSAFAYVANQTSNTASVIDTATDR